MCYNKIVYETISWSNLFSNKFLSTLKIPECQRILDNSNVQDIVRLQEQLFLKYQCFKFIGSLTMCVHDDIFYLIDGQHRYNAMKYLFEKYGNDYEYKIEYIYVDTIEDLKSVYEMLNKNTPLPELNIILAKKERNLLQETVHWFQAKYPLVWSKSLRTKRPNMYFNSFQETLSFILEHIEIHSSTEFIEIIEQYNNNHKNMKQDQMVKLKITKNMLEKADKLGFYLGLYSFNTNTDWGYEWGKRIVEIQRPGIVIKRSMSSVAKKKSISKTLRNKVWNTHVGENKSRVYCIVCQENIISMMDFECGHIMPEAHGGGIEINNLIPICGMCNKSMGTTCMGIFVSQQFPQNVKKYEDKAYNQPKHNQKNSLLSYLFQQSET